MTIPSFVYTVMSKDMQLSPFKCLLQDDPAQGFSMLAIKRWHRSKGDAVAMLSPYMGKDNRQMVWNTDIGLSRCSKDAVYSINPRLFF